MLLLVVQRLSVFDFISIEIVSAKLVKGAVHDFMGDFDVLHLVFCLAYMHKSAFID